MVVEDERDSRGCEVGVVGQRGDKICVLLTAEKIAEKALRLAGRHGEHAKAQVDHVDRSPFVKMPPMPDGSRHRHLARSGN